MYSYIFDVNTHGLLLTTQTGKYVANEIRPVFAPELALTGLDQYFEYNPSEQAPLLWGIKNTYLIAATDENGTPYGRKVAQLNGTQYGKPLNIQVFFDGKLTLTPVDVEAMVQANSEIMDALVADTKRRTKELYDESIQRCDTAYIAFSGGKDSVALLDICHRVLPLSVPIIFSDTDMELPDTYSVVEIIQEHYPDREFITARASRPALENWKTFGPPSRSIRWCCSVHKSTPALIALKKKLQKPAIRVMAFVGVRGDESHSRSFYEDASDGVKNASQLNRMPLLDWGGHELWLYILGNGLIINEAYKKGLTRVGCLMCPESSEKYEWFVHAAYSKALKPYSDIIIDTSLKQFSSLQEKKEFIGKRYWQARRSGIVLKETLTPPLEEKNGLELTFRSPYFRRDLFYEWIKTAGSVVKARGTSQQLLKLPKSIDIEIPFVYSASNKEGDSVCFTFSSLDEENALLPSLRLLFRKISACVGCQACETECSWGAITTINGKLKVDEDKCVRCNKCYDVKNVKGAAIACWRYQSMYKPENSNSVANKFACYRNFGLRREFIDPLLEHEDTFFQWNTEHPLGKDKVESCKSWFPQAMITTEGRKPTKLIELFRQRALNEVAWEFVWIALTNRSPLINWYCVTTQIDERKEVQELLRMLQESYPLTSNVKDRRLDALKNTAAQSPLGGDSKAVMLPEYKGKKVIALTRKTKEVHPLTILYGLYLIADLAQRGSFTVRELLTADMDSIFVSPIVAFGIAPDTFKKQCEGLRTRYPDYISTIFTLGNDGLEVYPQRHTLEDIINLALGDSQ